jgi:hypothetical protein
MWISNSRYLSWALIKRSRDTLSDEVMKHFSGTCKFEFRASPTITTLAAGFGAAARGNFRRAAFARRFSGQSAPRCGFVNGRSLLECLRP